MSKSRFVLDTNLIVSAALFKQSVTRQAFEKAITTGDILLSDALQAEVSEVLLRHEFDRYVSLETRLRFLSGFISLSTVVEILERIQVCRDPKDDMVLETAVNGQADIIITGDQDLLVLHPFRQIAVLSPRAFLDQDN
ncbi:MAG: putative toxin-antitoxin system toxin component, PIN family [Ardenticatenaceae bacterium]|nr:putative toxin-antitoxin system toxin component, PIN family [Ardenticatenaceae bacterium]MCB9442631.1 putative toxin-antitoxin system toxin component, PIN family [Ardenticatenaceae bacterium]